MKTVKRNKLLAGLLAMSLSFAAAGVVASVYDEQTAVAEQSQAQVVGASIRFPKEGETVTTSIRFGYQLNKNEVDINEVDTLGVLINLKSNAETPTIENTPSGGIGQNVVYIENGAQKAEFNIGRMEGGKFILDANGDVYNMLVYCHNVPANKMHEDFSCVGYYKLKGEGQEIQYSTPVYRSVAQVAYEAQQSDSTTTEQKGKLQAIIDGATDHKEVTLPAVAPTVSQNGKTEGKECSVCHKVIVAQKTVCLMEADEFEVYGSLTDNVPVANTLTVDVSEYYDGNEATVTFGKTAISATVVDGVVTVSGDAFGSTVYGEEDLRIVTDTCEIIQPLTVVTKYVSDRQDLQDMYYYGNPTSNKGYTGYFVMDDDINLENQEFLLGGSKDSLNLDVHLSFFNDMTTGFKGVFDGKGHKLYNFYVYKDSTGIFANVRPGAVVKNFALVGTIKGDKISSLGNFQHIRVLGQRFAGTLQNVYISFVPDSANSVYVPLIAQSIVAADFIDCVIKYDASNMVVRNTSGCWPAAVALAHWAYLDGTTIAANRPNAIYAIDDDFAPDYTNVYFVVTPPQKVGDGLLDRVYVGYELNSTEGANPALSRFVNTEFGEYGHPTRTGGAYAPTGLTHCEYTEEFTASFVTEDSYWEIVNGQPVYKSLELPINVQMKTATWSKYASLNGTTPVANTDGLEVDFAVGAPEIVSIDGVALTASDYTYAEGKIAVNNGKVSELALGEHTVAIQSGRYSYTGKLVVATKVIMNRQDLQDMYYYGNPDSSLKYTGYFVLGTDIDMNNQEFLVGGSASNVNANTYYTWDVNTGFAGTFDGLGHKLYNFYVAYGSTGLFGHVTLQGVAKNFAIVGKIKGAKTSNLAAFLNIRVLAQRFSGTLQNAYISLVPESAGDVYVPMIAQAIAKATIIDCVIKYDASGMAVRNSPATTWPAAVALAYYAYPDPGTLKGAGRTNVNPINDDFAPEFRNVYFVVTPPTAVGTGKLDRVYVDYELYSTEGADNALGRFINTAFGEYGHPQKADVQWAPTGLTHKGYTEEFTATFTDNTFWDTVNGQPVFKSAK